MDSLSQQFTESTSENKALMPPEIISNPDDLFRRIGSDPSAIGFSGKLESRVEMDARLEREQLELVGRLEKEKVERDARLEKEKLDDIHKRTMERFRFFLKEVSGYAMGIVLIVALGSTSTIILFDSSAPQESKAWAKTTLTAIATGVMGYVFGKSSTSQT